MASRSFQLNHVLVLVLAATLGLPAGGARAAAAPAATAPAEPTAYARRVIYLPPGLDAEQFQYMAAAAAAEHAHLVGLR